MGDFDRGVLVDMSHGRQLDSLLHNVIGGAVATAVRGVARPATQSGDVGPSSLVVNPREGCEWITLPLIAEDVVVAAVSAGFGFDEQVLPRQGVHEHVDESGACHHGSRYAEIRHARVVSSGGGHAAGRERERQNDVGERVNNHVPDDTLQPLQAFRMLASQDCGLGDPPA